MQCMSKTNRDVRDVTHGAIAHCYRLGSHYPAHLGHPRRCGSLERRSKSFAAFFTGGFAAWTGIIRLAIMLRTNFAVETCAATFILELCRRGPETDSSPLCKHLQDGQREPLTPWPDPEIHVGLWYGLLPGTAATDPE